MIQRSHTLLLLLGFLLIPIAQGLHAQSNVITANPNAQPLRKIWELRGRMEDRMGSGFGSVGDINGDSLDDFAVCETRQGLWHVFYGRSDSALSTTPVWTFDSSGGAPYYPVHGNFLGTGRRMVGFPRTKLEVIDDKPYIDYYLYLFRTDSFRLDTAHPLLLDLRVGSIRMISGMVA